MRIKNCFDSIRKINFTTNYDSTDIPQSYDSTIWINKNICKQISLKNNKPTLKYLETYDSNKKLIERIEYDLNEKIIEKIKWDNFANGNSMTCTFIDSNNQITGFALNKYNELGQKIRTEWYHHKTE